MQIENCGTDESKTMVVPNPNNCSIFVKVDTWKPDDHKKTSDTMYLLSDGSGGYYWDGNEWQFVSFGGNGGSGQTITFTDETGNTSNLTAISYIGGTDIVD